MKRAAIAATALAAVLAALAAAAPATRSEVPPVQGGSVLGHDLPLKVYASINPGVHLFGDPITAQVSVVADRKWVAPANVRVIVHFHPYRAAGPPTVTRASQRSPPAAHLDVEAALPHEAVPPGDEDQRPRAPLPLQPRARRIPVPHRPGAVRAERAVPADCGPLRAEPVRGRRHPAPHDQLVRHAHSSPGAPRTGRRRASSSGSPSRSRPCSERRDWPSSAAGRSSSAPPGPRRGPRSGLRRSSGR